MSGKCTDGEIFVEFKGLFGHCIFKLFFTLQNCSPLVALKSCGFVPVRENTIKLFRFERLAETDVLWHTWCRHDYCNVLCYPSIRCPGGYSRKYFFYVVTVVSICMTRLSFWRWLSMWQTHISIIYRALFSPGIARDGPLWGGSRPHHGSQWLGGMS